MIIKRAVAAAVLAAIPLAVASPAHAVAARAPLAVSALPAEVSPEGAVHAQTILNKVNELRASKGLSPVSRFVELDNVAQGWSEGMAASRNMEHNPAYSDSYPAGWSRVAENVAMRGGDGDVGTLIFEQWLNSPGHYANMVEPDTNAIGIGIALDSSSGAWYATQNFATYQDTSALTPSGGGSAPAPPPSSGSASAPQQPAPPQTAPPTAPDGPTTAPPEQPTPSVSTESSAASAPETPSGTQTAPSSASAGPTTSTTAPAAAQPASSGAESRGAGGASAEAATVSVVAGTSDGGGATGGSSLAQTGTSIAAAFIAQALVGAGLFLLLRRRRRSHG